MGIQDWNWLLPADRQDYAWDCAACSTAWAMRTVGYPHSEQDVIAGLGPGRISPSLGLLDASGAGLVSYLAEQGITAENNANATWDDMQAAAGFQPMVMGGRAWNHWVGVRMGYIAADGGAPHILVVMNPSPGYMGIGETMDAGQFSELGPFSAVWFTSW